MLPKSSVEKVFSQNTKHKAEVGTRKVDMACVISVL